MVLGAAVQRHGQNARDGGFADAPVPAEDVAMSDTLLLDGVLQGAGDVLLTDHVGKLLGSVFARQNLVTHGRKFRLYGLGLWNGRTPELGHNIREWGMRKCKHCSHYTRSWRPCPRGWKHCLMTPFSSSHPRHGRSRKSSGHLLDSAANNHQRIVRAQLEDNPAMPGYDGPKWVSLHAYQKRDWHELIGLWKALNRQLLSAAEAVPDSAW